MILPFPKVTAFKKKGLKQEETGVKKAVWEILNQMDRRGRQLRGRHEPSK